MSIQRQQILNCACDLYLSEGLAGFSMRKLAKCVGCTAPALYRHYKNREEVVRDVVGEAYRLFSQYLHTALAGRTPVERWIRAGQAYVDFALEQRAYYEVLYAPVEVIGVHRDEGVVADQACSINQFWSDRVREMIDSGYLKEGDPHDISVTLWGLGHGLISIFHRGLLGVRTHDEFRAVISESFFRLMAGIGTERFLEIMEEIQVGGSHTE
jgi:AcrR family transcriptional regulator